MPTTGLLVVSMLWLVICLVLGLAANGLVCVVMIRSKRLWKNLSSFLIFHLSLADIIFRLVSVPLALLFVLTVPVPKVSFGCKLHAFITHTSAAATFVSLAAIALERQRTITHPLQRLKSYPKPLAVAAIIWLYASMASAGFVYSIESTTLNTCRGNETTEDCTVTRCSFPINWKTKVSVTVNFVLSFGVPLLVLIASYTRITYTLRYRAKKGMVHGTVVKSISKSVRMLVVVVLGFVMCWGPQFVVTALYSYEVLDVTTMNAPLVITTLFQFASSVVNPIIYGFYSKDFLKDCLACCCLCHCPSPSVHCPSPSVHCPRLVCNRTASQVFELGNSAPDANVVQLASVRNI